ncbi:hypothetical protein ABPG72_010222 [Tetrahymena utriculariae]
MYDIILLTIFKGCVQILSVSFFFFFLRLLFPKNYPLSIQLQPAHSLTHTLLSACHSQQNEQLSNKSFKTKQANTLNGRYLYVVKIVFNPRIRQNLQIQNKICFQMMI